MYQNKKIALFISHIYGDYQQGISQGVVHNAYDYGYPVEIYTTSDGEDLGAYGKGESSILRIPNFDDIDGVIFASGTYTDRNLSEEIRELLKKEKCPVVEITEQSSDFPYIVLENNKVTATLTEHMITVHGAKKLCYLGHKRERYFSRLREGYFKGVLEKYHLNFDESSIYLTDETEASYLEAINQFTQNGSSMPDAVICYNDRIALAFIGKAAEEGYHIPDDFAVTGCDCLEEGQFINPPLTTITFPVEEVGAKSMDMLFEMIKGKNVGPSEVVASPVINASCGCKVRSPFHSFSYLRECNRKIADLELSMFKSMKLSSSLSHVTDIDEGCDIIANFVTEIVNCSEFYMCLYSNWDSVTDPVLALADAVLDREDFEDAEDSLILKLAIKDGKRLAEYNFPKTTLLPDAIKNDSNSTYIVTPLFFEGRTFGYLAISFGNNQIQFPFKLEQWIMNIAQFLQNICEARRTSMLSQHLEEIYLKDALTGLFNQHGFKKHQDRLLELASPASYVTAMLMDLDKLKTINDHFGHEEGDFALRTIGQAIKQAQGENDIAARFSGDEFYLLLFHEKEGYAEELIEKIEKYINNFNKLSSKPYYVSESSGYITENVGSGLTDADIQRMYSHADKKMYDKKHSKERNVLR
ncbi:MAG: GGDEF domain-containing protein [Lachnospiraceae bacterium]|nr:GGDEF domain-containing protein [Lachnospiraceae bacterium]